MTETNNAEIDLEAKRHELTVNTLKEVVDNLNQVVSIRNQETKIELYFNAATTQMNYQLKMTSSGGSVTSGSLITTSNSEVLKQEKYQILPFPFIFLHQIVYLSTLLNKEVTYILNHPDKTNVAIVDKFLETAISINCVFSDPKFTEIDLMEHFSTQVADHVSIHLIYKDYTFQTKFSGFVGSSDINAPNLCDTQLLKDVEKKIHHVIKALKYLRSDVCRWAIQE